MLRRFGRLAPSSKGLDLSFLLGGFSGFTTNCFRASRQFSRARAFCEARGGDAGEADARLITVCELDARGF